MLGPQNLRLTFTEWNRPMPAIVETPRNDVDQAGKAAQPTAALQHDQTDRAGHHGGSDQHATEHVDDRDTGHVTEHAGDGAAQNGHDEVGRSAKNADDREGEQAQKDVASDDAGQAADENATKSMPWSAELKNLQKQLAVVRDRVAGVVLGPALSEKWP